MVFGFMNLLMPEAGSVQVFGIDLEELTNSV
jgi:hypothetical protein